jgi:D-alanyl-D-alanine carboxypeptidase
MLPSGNDAALAIARHVAGSDAAFVAEMNALIERLGLTESRFVNPHGLGGAGHASSAHDLAMLARYAMTLPEFRAVVSAPAWTASGSRNVPMYNLMNGVLYGVPGADGVKSGYTRSAGRTMVASAVRDGRRLYAVVLNDPAREADVLALLNWGFSAFDWQDAAVALGPELPALEPPPAQG